MKTSDVPYSMPAIWPSYPEPPYLYKGGDILSCIFRARAEAVRWAVPKPLKPLGGNLVFAWINDFNVVGFGRYNEAVVGIPVDFHGRAGSYMAYHFLDNESAMAGGREIWGFPKRQACFTSLRDADVITRSVVRNEEEILRISMEMTRPGASDPFGCLRQPLYNLKIIPSVKKDSPPDVKQLTAASLQNIVIHRVVSGKTTINFNISPRSSRYSLAPCEVIEGFYCTLDFDLAHGDVIHDYLDLSILQPKGGKS